MVATLDIDGTPIHIELDLSTGTWLCDAPQIDDAAFPLVVAADGTSFELYDDGTFSEQAPTR
jgi:hypothetical protein